MVNIHCHCVRSTHWEGFTQCIQLLGENSSALRNSEVITPEALLKLASNTCIVSRQSRLKSTQNFHETMAFGDLASSAGPCFKANLSALWLPLDLVLEEAVQETEINARCAVETISGKEDIISEINFVSNWHNGGIPDHILYHFVQVSSRSFESQIAPPGTTRFWACGLQLFVLFKGLEVV